MISIYNHWTNIPSYWEEVSQIVNIINLYNAAKIQFPCSCHGLMFWINKDEFIRKFVK